MIIQRRQRYKLNLNGQNWEKGGRWVGDGVFLASGMLKCKNVFKKSDVKGNNIV